MRMLGTVLFSHNRVKPLDGGNTPAAKAAKIKTIDYKFVCISLHYHCLIGVPSTKMS